MLLDDQPTPFDVRFRFLGFPVRVAVWFWLTMALLGEWTIHLGGQYLLLWIACGFISVLVHELGHAAFYRWFGSGWCEIVLRAFGGYASPDEEPGVRWKRIVVYLAGPGFGFLLLGLVVAVGFGLSRAEVNVPTAVGYALLFLFVMNLFWSLFNLLPIWPLDGGRVCRELCQASSARNPDAIAFGISFFTAAALVLIGVLAYLRSLPPAIAESLPFIPSPFMTVFLAVFAYSSYQLWQQAKQRFDWDDGDGWRR